MREVTTLLTGPWAGFLALAALLLWPGLLIVRAPWPFVPLLSLSFWLVSWGWLAPGGPGRQRYLLVVLAFSALVSGLRLLKPLGSSRPSWPSFMVVAAALARLLPFFSWLVPPGLDPAFSSSSALLLVWRDGLPASYLPLYPISGFGLGDSGLATLAADVSLLAGLAPYRALLLVTLASEGLLILALFAFARRFWPEAWSSLGAVTGAAIGLLLAARPEVQGGTLLALALAVGGASLVVHARGRSVCVAAGALWAGGAAVSGLLVVGGGLATSAPMVTKQRGRALGRLGLAVAVAVLLAGAVLWRTAAARLAAPGPIPLALLVFILMGIPRIAPRCSSEPKGWVIGGCLVATLVATLADWNLRSTELRVSADEIAAAAWLRDNSRSTEVVCAGDEAARAWVPALAGRATSKPLLPDSVRPVAGFGLPQAPCRFLWGPSGPLTAPAAFRQGRVSVARLTPERTPAGP
jgi:hypothetical protein